jgi:predicted nuclease of predicted toxin-antitoxin system
LLLDVHVAVSLANALREAGHDVLRAGIDYHDWSDDRLLRLARSERRIVVTEDSDYTNLVFVHRQPPPLSILYLRASAAELPALKAPVMEVLAAGRFENHIVVITPTRIRYRPFPETSHDHDLD